MSLSGLTNWVVTVDTTNANAGDRDGAQFVVNAYNAVRAAMDPPLPPLATSPNNVLFDSYLLTLQEWQLPNMQEGWIKSGSSVSNSDRKFAFNSAPTAVQNQVDALLEPYLPSA